MRATEPAKSATAFRTISEVSGELELPQHVLRFWETKFPQIRPLKRGGGRRYYRPEDVALLLRIQRLLYSEGYTIRGVQRLLRESRRTGVQPPAESGAPDPSPFLHEAPIEAPHERVPPSVEAEAEGDEGPPAGDEEGEPADAPLHLSDDVRRELEAVLSELRAMRALLGRNHD